jgi:PAS domain S-box-containing protein
MSSPNVDVIDLARRIRSAALHFWLLGIAVLLATGTMAQGTTSPRVLLLFSHDRLLPANQRYDEGIRQALNSEDGQSNISIFGEFLDSNRLGGPEREAAMENYLKERYRETPPDVLVPLGPSALDFCLARRDSLFPGVPLVFGGVGSERSNQVQGLPEVAGLPMELTVTPTVEALLAMRPQTREIFLVHGSSVFDRNWLDTARRQCARFADRVKITDFPELPLSELKTRLRALPKDSAVLYLTYFQSPQGETYTPARVAPEIAAASSVPVVGLYDTYMGSGVLGVSVSPFAEDGLVLGKLIRRVISGEKAQSIGVLPPNPTRLILDARQMERWGIKAAPVGAEVRFRTPTLWEEHRAGIVVTITVIALQGLLIAGLIVARMRQGQAEKELRSSEARFSGIFRGSPAAISIVRQADGRILDVNPEWESITGFARADAIGRTPIETGMVIGSDEESGFREFLKTSRRLHDYEQAILKPDGSTRWLSLSTELISLRDEPCYVVLAKDVTELREAEEARQQLAHASRLAILGEMTASIAHEINQPLGAILSNTDAAEMLLEQPEPILGEVKQILADIRRDDIRASTVIKRVRALVGRREVRLREFDLNASLLETLTLITHDARRRGVRLVHELADDLPKIHADAVQIDQVILNLLFNAMDAMKNTPAGFRTLVVRSLCKSSDDAVEVAVEDSGHGISPEKFGRIFDSFFTTKEGGMGVGLALARSIAEAHGGDLIAENNASTGATFHLILPVNSSNAHNGNGHSSFSRPPGR